MQDNDEKPADAAVQDDQEPTLGSLLAAARADKELQLKEIADEMRIDPSVLVSLENDEIEGLGEPVFVKGYIKQYGRQLGLSYDVLLAAYYRQVGSHEVEIRPTRSIQLRDERQIAAWIIAGLVLLLVAVMLFVWWLGGGAEPVADIGPVTGTTTDAIGEPPRAPAAAPPSPPAVVSAPGPNSADQRNGGVVEQRFAAQSSGPLVAAGDRVAVTEARADDVDSVRTTLDAAVDESDFDPELIDVVIEFDEDCWTEIRDDRGQTLYYDLASSGAVVTVRGKAPINVFLGNADGVSLTVDGEDFSIPAGSRRDDLANFVISQSRD